MSPAKSLDVSGGVLDTNAAAEYIAVTAGTLRYWRSTGQGPASFKLGPRKVGYLRSELDRWLRAQIVEGEVAARVRANGKTKHKR